MKQVETKKKIDESAFLLVRNSATNNIQLVASPSSFQVGLSQTPADMILKGKICLSEKKYTISNSNSWSINIDDNVTIASIITSYSIAERPSRGYSSVVLPNNSRHGQLLIVKDFSGASGVIPIRITTEGGLLIDGASYQTIATNYGSIRLCWHGEGWMVI